MTPTAADIKMMTPNTLANARLGGPGPGVTVAVTSLHARPESLTVTEDHRMVTRHRPGAPSRQRPGGHLQVDRDSVKPGPGRIIMMMQPARLPRAAGPRHERPALAA